MMSEQRKEAELLFNGYVALTRITRQVPKMPTTWDNWVGEMKTALSEHNFGPMSMAFYALGRFHALEKAEDSRMENPQAHINYWRGLIDFCADEGYPVVIE